MRIESSYPTPIHGVSTLAPRNRSEGQAGLQINFRSDPVNKLTRRPPMKWVASLLVGNNGDNILYHSYEREGVTYRFILDKITGALHIYTDTTFWGTINVPVGYVGTNMVAQTVDHETFFVNKEKVVKMRPDNDLADIERVSHLNVTAALNYGETVQVNVTKSNGERHVVTYAVPDLGTSEPDYDTADKARATKQVALELAARINGGGVHTTLFPNPDYPEDPYNDTDFQTYCQPYRADGFGGFEPNPSYDTNQSVCKAYKTNYTGIEGVTAVALGSSVAVWEDGRAAWLDLEVETGQGDRSCVAINNTIENTDGLPLYAVAGTRITVKPDPTSNKGIYYLQAERTAQQPSGESLEEVVWSETRNAEQPHAIDETTMPFRCTFENNEFTVGTIPFKERQSGDDDSVPQPDFVGETITNIGYFQKRLVFVSKNNVIMSEAADEVNFWKQSAVQLLVNDTVSVASSAVAIDKLAHIVPHNRDLLVIASNGQFKIDGGTGITPETISMALTTKYECQISVPPVTIGNSVFFPIDYGTSTGLQEYTGERDTNQDFASPLTHHVIGYMDGQAKLMTASPNLEMIAVVTEGAAGNQLFMYEQYTDDTGKRRQRSWSEWILSGNSKIIDIEFRNDRLTLIVNENNNIVLKEIDMYSRVSTGINEVYLDDLMKVSTDGLTATLDANYDAENIIVVRGDNTDYELNKAQFTIENNVITFMEDISAGSVYIGKIYESRYRPTRPFKYDENGIAITTDRIRISKYILSLVETNEVKMHIISKYYDTEDQVFNSRYVGELNNLVGEIPFHTGDLKFSFAQDANLAEAEFYCDNWLGCTIAGLSWEGQYFQSAGRM